MNTEMDHIQNTLSNKLVSEGAEENQITFNLISEFKALTTGQNKRFVCGIELELNSKIKNTFQRQPIDVLCLIDNSGSMQGDKASLVRKSLKYLLKILGSEDQVCLISFETQAKVLCPFVINNDQNKQRLKSGIKKIVGLGGTNVLPAFECAMKHMKEREKPRQQTFILLLTDGEFNDRGNLKNNLQKLIRQCEMDQQFYIFTYGYGEDHNPQILQEIAGDYNGKYYFISNIENVTEWFLLSMSSILNSAWKDIRIRLQQSQNNLVRITETFGGEQIWKQNNTNDQDGVFEIQIPLLIHGDKKCFVFECTSYAQSNHQEQNNSSIILQADLSFIELDSGKDKIRTTPTTKNLIMQFLPEQQSAKEMDSELNGNLIKIKLEDNAISNSSETYYENLMITYYRGVGGKRIQEASTLIQKEKNYGKAKELLNTFQTELIKNCSLIDTCKQIRKSQFTENAKLNESNNQFDNQQLIENKGIQHLLEDIQDAKNRCNPKNYHQAHFQKMNAVHERRSRSRSHDEDWNDDNKQTMGRFRDRKIILSDSSSDSRSNSAIQKRRRSRSNKRALNNHSSSSQSADRSDDSVSSFQKYKKRGDISKNQKKDKKFVSRTNSPSSSRSYSPSNSRNCSPSRSRNNNHSNYNSSRRRRSNSRERQSQNYKQNQKTNNLRTNRFQLDNQSIRNNDQQVEKQKSSQSKQRQTKDYYLSSESLHFTTESISSSYSPVSQKLSALTQNEDYNYQICLSNKQCSKISSQLSFNNRKYSSSREDSIPRQKRGNYGTRNNQDRKSLRRYSRSRSPPHRESRRGNQGSRFRSRSSSYQSNRRCQTQNPQ